ncbi:MAG TPA: 2-hydroxyacid dehydrogenase [Bryobacteraceae bacterium]
MSFTVAYWNPGATPELRRLMSSEMPAGWRLMIPGQDATDERVLAECDFLVVADRAITGEHLAAAPKLKMIQHQGVGYERIDTAACARHGILLGLTPEGTTTGVAEHTILLILALYKQLVKAATAAREGRWLQWELRQASFELSGKTLGLAGFGRIGREVARRALAFDAHILFYDPYTQENGGERCATFRELCHKADIVSLHLPANAGNNGMINKETLGWMRPHAILVNTSRGALVDEPALIAALQEGKIAGAALDVLAQEPPDAANPLLGMENVLVTPHIAAGTRDAFSTKMRAVFANLRRFARGEPPCNIVPELNELLNGRYALKDNSPNGN